MEGGGELGGGVGGGGGGGCMGVANLKPVGPRTWRSGARKCKSMALQQHKKIANLKAREARAAGSSRERCLQKPFITWEQQETNREPEA